jgi:hypothetical protein
MQERVAAILDRHESTPPRAYDLIGCHAGLGSPQKGAAEDWSRAEHDVVQSIMLRTPKPPHSFAGLLSSSTKQNASGLQF